LDNVIIEIIKFRRSASRRVVASSVHRTVPYDQFGDSGTQPSRRPFSASYDITGTGAGASLKFAALGEITMSHDHTHLRALLFGLSPVVFRWNGIREISQSQNTCRLECQQAINTEKTNRGVVAYNTA